MDIQVLRNFVEIVESGSITAASKKLYVAQPALSIQLKALEKELGTVLLIRSAHRLELTPAGKMLYRRAKAIAALENSIIRDAAEYSSGSGGIIRMAADHQVSLSLLNEFCSRYPDVKYEIFRGEPALVLEMLDSGAADMAAVRTPCTLTADMTGIRLSSDSMAAVFGSRYFSFGGAESCTPEELLGKPLIILRRYERLITELLSDAARSAKKADKAAAADIIIRCTDDDISAAISAAATGTGIALLPLSSFDRSIFGGDTECIPVDEKSFFTDRLIVTKKNRVLSNTEKQFMEYAAAHGAGTV